MLLQVYSIHDSKSGIYNAPMFFRTHGEAERFIKDASTKVESPLSKFPEDFSLVHLGAYDDATGILERLASPVHVARAIDLKSKDADLRMM